MLEPCLSLFPPKAVASSVHLKVVVEFGAVVYAFVSPRNKGTKGEKRTVFVGSEDGSHDERDRLCLTVVCSLTGARTVSSSQTLYTPFQCCTWAGEKPQDLV